MRSRPSHVSAGEEFVFRCALMIICLSSAWGCYDGDPPKPYGEEHRLAMPGSQAEVWAVAPAINLSGHREVDAILQADLLFDELQEVKGITVVPVNRVAQVYAGLNIKQVESPQEATLVCDLLHADALVVPTVTAYDPYNPPKMAASLALFRRPAGYTRPDNIDVRELINKPDWTPPADLKQAVGMYDSADGSVREPLLKYAAGRSDPNGPMAEREYFLSMDRYSEFVYHQLIADLLGVPAEPPDKTHRKHENSNSTDAGDGIDR
jgi:hypothetical protein